MAVIGATGTIGQAVTEALAAGGASGVVAISRRVDAASLPPGVRAAQADLTQPESLDGALANVDAVFLVWTAPPDAAPAAIERIARHARRLVLLSAPYKTPHPFFQQPNPMAALQARIEGLIEASGVAWTFLRPGMFAANAIGWWASQIRKGDVVRWPYADAATAPIDERDIAAVAERVLQDDGHAGRDYVLTGPDSLTQAEQVKIIGEVLGRDVVLEEISPEQARTELPFPPVAMNMLLGAWRAAVGLPAFLTNDVAAITGRQPHTFREWVAWNVSAFRA
ncbi:MAG: NAD(P)H-binding protein [Acidobacteria bacterium]|nr:NAD(P)H-binding protein [Acidobacteriota bacterium]